MSEREPLWSDMDILEVLIKAEINSVPEMAAMTWMRDEYEARIAELEAQNKRMAKRIMYLEEGIVESEYEGE